MLGVIKNPELRKDTQLGAKVFIAFLIELASLSAWLGSLA